jgi:hypothetical protein
MEEKEIKEQAKTLMNLLAIGEILFKDARDLTPAELKAKRALLKEKFTKVKDKCEEVG